MLINEIDIDTPGLDRLEFIELFDGGVGFTDLSSLSLVFYAVNKKQKVVIYNHIDLTKKKTDKLGYFLIGNMNIQNADLIIKDNSIRNGPAAIALYNQPAFNYPIGGKLSLTKLVDAVVYDTNDPDNSELLRLLNPFERQLNENSDGNGTINSLQRCPNGINLLRKTGNYQLARPTAKRANQCLGCGEPATKIHFIQGTSAASFEVDKSHTVEAVITGLFLGKNALNGLFIQEEDSDMDDNAATSEGLFLHYPGKSPTTLRLGDLIRVTGKIKEYYGLTEMTNITSLNKCSTKHTVSSSILSLPAQNSEYFESLENMRINFNQPMWIIDNNELGRYGTLTLSATKRLFQSTQRHLPEEGLQSSEKQFLQQILVDDGLSRLYSKPILPSLSADNPIRKGDKIQHLDGILSYAFKQYRINPISTYTIIKSNKRKNLQNKGNMLRIAGLNLQNYFNGSQSPAGFTNSRGANTLQEFARQKSKIVAAIKAINADIIGIMEIENDGFGPKSAIVDLTQFLNLAEQTDKKTYAFIQPESDTIGNDEITVGLLYRIDKVSPIGKAEILEDYPFNQSIRPPMAQTFRNAITHNTITVVVNHFKSKTCRNAKGLNTDQLDGQGCWNERRVESVKSLVKWLKNNPTHTAMKNTLIFGDLNAYAKEDPLVFIKGNGYTDLIDKFIGADAYTFVYNGVSGYLDHALADRHLETRVKNVTIWHINADEPSVLDYNLENKSKIEEVLLYAPDEFRSSDHDPVIIDVEL